MYLLDLSKKEQAFYDELVECLTGLDKSIEKMLKAMKLNFSDSILENIQPIIDTLTWVGIAIVVLVWVFQFADFLISSRMKVTWESVSKELIKLAVGVIAVQYAPTFCNWCITICNQLMIDINTSVDSFTIKEVFMDMEEVAKKIEDLNRFELETLKLSLMIPKSALFLGSGLMRFISFIRKAYVLVYMIVAPIAFSMVSAKGIKGLGKFAVAFIGYVGQGPLAMIFFKVYQILVAEEVFVEGSIMGCMWDVTILTGILLFMIMGSCKVIKDIF